MTAPARVFLMLQGPHGPFFDRLARQLRAAGAAVWRVGFNAGDEFFWSDKAHFIRHTAPTEDWPAHLDALIARLGVTDMVLYGDVRPVHAAARRAAAARGLTLHVFEEGYLRPYWVTYERGGSNGHSELMEITQARMEAALRGAGAGEVRRPPNRWGDLRQHKFYGALYHAMVLGRNRAYPGWRSHRNITVRQEFRLNLRSLLLQPVYAARRLAAEARIRRAGFPYVLVLMQLEHDSSFQAHSPYATTGEFIREVLAAFAQGAPAHHHLVFKAHPLEDGRAGAPAIIREEAARLGLGPRVHHVHGGKLSGLLAYARAAVTVNSTSAHQALWRGLPVRAMGRAVYARPGITSDQPLPEFFAAPQRPDPNAYRLFRDYLLETSQLPGGFYATMARAHVLRLVVDLMLAADGPYAALDRGQGLYRLRPGDEH